MEPLYILLLALVIAILVTWRMLTGSARQQPGDGRVSAGMQPRAASDLQTSAGRYAAKTLRICNNPCRAALTLRDQSFLASEAPALPLPDCDRACYCRLTRHRDRRIKDDRRYPAADIVADSNLLLPDSAVINEDARKGDERRRKSGR